MCLHQSESAGELCDQLKLGLERRIGLREDAQYELLQMESHRAVRSEHDGADKTAVSCLAGLPQEQEQLPKLFTAEITTGPP